MGLEGVPESRLDERARAGLPTDAPPAPWTCRCDAVVWFARPARDLPGGGGRPWLVAGALIDYADSPVGPYHEVLGLLAGFGRTGPVATVPFIAVDSPASLVGGRQNWALPKVLAQFADGTAAGAGWTVSATARAVGPAVPTAAAPSRPR